MFQIDDKFLEEVGLGGLPAEQKEAVLAKIREMLELRVGTKLSEGLTEAQLSEFESFMNRDVMQVTSWLDANAPDFEQDEIYQRLKASAPEGVAMEALLAEYASLKWLNLNRPNYREVVMSTIEELKKEISANPSAVLGS